MTSSPDLDFLTSARVQSANSYLFSTLARDLLGVNAALILAKLYSNGKLTFKDLVVKTKLNKKKIKVVLVTLIQLKCIQYSIGNEKQPTVTYNVDEEGLLLFLYSGEIITTIKQRYDDDAIAEIVQNFLSYGNLTISDYVNNFEDDNDFKKIEIENKFNILIQEGWLVPIKSNLEFQNKLEIYIKMYKRNYANYPKTTAISDVKRKKEVKAQTETEFNKLFTLDPQDIYETNKSATSATLNRFTSSRINSSSGEAMNLKKLRKDVSFKISLNRFFKASRTNVLVKFVRQRLGNLSAKIYESILKHVEKNSPDCFRFALDYNNDYLFVGTLLDDVISPNASAASSDIPAKSYSLYLSYIKSHVESKKNNCFTLQEVSSLINNININLLNSIKFRALNSRKRAAPDSSNEQPAKRVKNEADLDPSLESANGNSVNGNGTAHHVEDDNEPDLEEEEASDNNNPRSIGLLHQHIELMMTCSIPFIKQNANGTYYVPFSELVESLKRFSYMYLVKSALGLNEFKVLNCIIKRKLIDEKSLINMTLLQENDVRVCVNKLFKLQAIEVQEIPKTMDRQANRSAFAYRFNNKFSTHLVENNLLHEMALLFNNVSDVKEKNKLLLSKVNRDDIKGRETELLLTSELNQLKWLNEKELNCVARIHRARVLWETFAIL